MKNEKLAHMVGITVCICGLLIVSSCSKDEFFRIEDTPSIDLQTMNDIAESQLYIDYQKAYFTLAQELSNIDSTNIGRVVISDGDTLFENVRYISFGGMIELYDSLLKVYPELKEVDEADLMQIQKIALSKNLTLLEMVPQSKITKGYKTKGSTDKKAFIWCENNTTSLGIGNFCSFACENEDWQGLPSTLQFLASPLPSIGLAYEQAILWSEGNDGCETGGFGWDDDSGVTMICEETTSGWTPMPRAWGSPIPYSTFHVHPSNDLEPSIEYDLPMWANSGLRYHFIVGYNREVSAWYYNG